jgi:hypothetical protein
VWGKTPLNMLTSPSQTRTPVHLVGRSQKSALVAEFAGKHLSELRTPALVIDRALFAKNCDKMHANATGYGAAFRAHIKSHKVKLILWVGWDIALKSLADCRRNKASARIRFRHKLCRCGVNVDGSVGSGKIWTRRRGHSERCM